MFRRIVTILLPLCVTGCTSQAQVVISDATTFAAAGIVDIAHLIPDIALDIRYAGANNFVGERIDAYEAPRCMLLRTPAEALQRVESDLRTRGLRLRIFDCYRPLAAVKQFVRWAEDPDDQRMKTQFYPNLPKSALLGEYIAPVSGHSRAATIDLTLVRCGPSGPCAELDMGTPFDFFDTRAHTDVAGLTDSQRANRDLLRDTMRTHGFENYAAEWWHYTYRPEPSPTTAYDIPIR